ncbi:MAG: hypothetical protein HQK50_02620 [Oligoflexia bacterium]|nr:hypothetical protein [Oligoflexia bacterium]MBF0364434.1 hypothetical protein [Oligoflexia bacterium]
MMNNLLKTKISLIVSLTLLLSVILLVSLHFVSKSLGRHYLIQDGVNTCFSRVMQSFMAYGNSMGPSTKYLQDNFLRMTQECFGEVQQELEDTTSKVAALEKMNKISSSVFQFHQSIKQQGHMETLVPLFSQIESAKDSLLEEIDVWKKRSGDFYSLIMGLVATTLLLALGAFWILTFSQRRLRELNRASEQDALDEVERKDSPSCVKVEELMKKTLEQNDLIHCSKLFSHYNNFLLENALWGSRPLQKPENTASEGASDFSNVSGTVESKEDTPSEPAAIENAEAASPLQGVDLNKITNNLVNIFSKKLFVNGIILKIDTIDNMLIWGKEDVVQKIFFHLMSELVQTFGEKDQERRIRIMGKIVRDSVIIEFLDNAKAEIAFKHGESTSSDFTMNFCMEMMRQFGGSLIFEPTRSSSEMEKKEKSDAVRFTLFFRRVDTQSAKLVNLKVGKKKDLLNAMNLDGRPE